MYLQPISVLVILPGKTTPGHTGPEPRYFQVKSLPPAKKRRAALEAMVREITCAK